VQSSACSQSQLSALLVDFLKVNVSWVPTGPGKSWNFLGPFSRPGKSWKTAKVMESSGK